MRASIDAVDHPHERGAQQDQHDEARIERSAREIPSEPIVSGELSVRTNQGQPPPDHWPNTERENESPTCNTANGDLTIDPTQSSAEAEPERSYSRDRNEHQYPPYPRGTTGIDPVEEKPVTMKYVEVESCWYQKQHDEERVPQEGLHAPHGVGAMTDFLTASVGGESPGRERDEQQKK